MEYTPYLLTQDEADLLTIYRQFMANKRGSSSPSGAISAGLPTVAPSPEAAAGQQLVIQLLGKIADQVATTSVQVLAALSSNERTLKTMSDAFTTETMALQADITAQTTVIASATAAFKGLAAQLASVEAQLSMAGATPAQVAIVTGMRTSLEANTAALAAAIPPNTAAASEPPPAATGTDTTAGGGAAVDPNAPVGQGTAI